MLISELDRIKQTILTKWSQIERKIMAAPNDTRREDLNTRLWKVIFQQFKMNSSTQMKSEIYSMLGLTESYKVRRIERTLDDMQNLVDGM